MSKKKLMSKKEAMWVEAKRRCHLSAEDVCMVKEMGINPEASSSKTSPADLNLGKRRCGFGFARCTKSVNEHER